MVIISKEKHQKHYGQKDHWENSRSVEILDLALSALSLRQIILTSAVICPRHCFENQAIQRRRYFDIAFLFHKFDVISIGNLKHFKSSERNSTQPEVFVMFFNGQGLGSQSEVKVNPSFLTIWKLNGNQSPRRQEKHECAYLINMY